MILFNANYNNKKKRIYFIFLFIMKIYSNISFRRFELKYINDR